jgi:hypothetical protein
MAEDKTETGDERLGLLSNMGGAAIDDQKNLVSVVFAGLLGAENASRFRAVAVK